MRIQTKITIVGLATLTPLWLSARTLPEDWDWTEIWPRKTFTLEPSFIHSNGEQVYLVTPDFALASEDGITWEKVSPEPLLEAEYPDQRIFVFRLHFRSENPNPPEVIASYPITDFIATDYPSHKEWLEDGSYLQIHTVHMLKCIGEWWGTIDEDIIFFDESIIFSSNNGTIWNRVEPDNSTLNTYGNATQIVGDEKACYLLATPQYSYYWNEINHIPPYIFEVSPNAELTELGQSLQQSPYPQAQKHFFHKGTIFSRLPDRTEKAFFANIPPTSSEILEYSRPSMLNKNTLLMLNHNHVVIVEDPLDPSSLPQFIPFPGALPKKLETVSGIALIIDEDGACYRSVDGYSWELTATGYKYGGLSVDGDDFVFCTLRQWSRTKDGINWLIPSPAPFFKDYLYGDAVWKGGDFIPEIGLQLEWVFPYPFGGITNVARVTNTQGHSWTIELSDSVYYTPQADERQLDLAYGNGLIVGGFPDEFVLDDSLNGSVKFGDLFQRTRFQNGRFLGLKKINVFSHSINSMSSKAFVSSYNAVYLSDPAPPYPFSGGFLKENGWRKSDWFGWVFTKHYPWVYQYPAGWIYILGPDETNCWMWDTTEGWFWSNRDHWPEIWDKEKGWRQHANIEEWVW